MISKLVANIEKQHRALKLRIYPNEQQELLINKTFGCCRQIYNNRLFERNQFYEIVIRKENDKKKQKELWKTAHSSSEKEMQEKFAEFVRAVDAQKAKAQQSLDKAETLYKALMQEYFG